jgi:hypothetical protein
VLFLQQLGRGLRAAEGKSALQILDFVGNHRIFVERLRALASLGASQSTEVLQRLVETGSASLPGGCEVEVELEAKYLLEAMFRVGGAEEVKRAYRELREMRSARPTAGEMQRMGYLPSALRQQHETWFAWVASEGDLSTEEVAALAKHGAFLRALEISERMQKSYKMVTLEVLLDREMPDIRMPVEMVARRSWEYLRQDPSLLAEVPDEVRPGSQPSAEQLQRWTKYWMENPITAWTNQEDPAEQWLRLDGDVLAFNVAIEPALRRMMRELVDYRLAAHRARRPSTSASDFVCAVTWNQRDPILKLPRSQVATIPDGEVDVRLRDGSVWIFRFKAEFCNVARPFGASRNQLPDLLRRWFGPSAGQPGTAFRVRFFASADGLWVDPVQQAGVASVGRRSRLPAYPDLAAAAGRPLLIPPQPGHETVWLPFDGPEASAFAVRVAGHSMDGGVAPIRDGDWAVFEPARALPIDALAGRVVLVQLPQSQEGAGRPLMIKRVQQAAKGIAFGSDNPDFSQFPSTRESIVIGRLVGCVQPESIAPQAGTAMSMEVMQATFGAVRWPLKTGRDAGHLVLVLGDGARLTRPDRIDTDLRPGSGEAAYVFTAAQDGARFLGIARWLGTDEGWDIPNLPLDVWVAFGGGRLPSRALPQDALGQAEACVRQVLELPVTERLLVPSDGGQGRMLGSSPCGGLRVDAGDVSRRISLADIAWAIVAWKHAQANGLEFSLRSAKALRYVEGTPESAMRSGEMRWALAISRKFRDTGEFAGLKVNADDGSVMDATYDIEVVSGALTLVFDAKWGSSGGKGSRNVDYNPGLAILLERLGRAQIGIADLIVDTENTRGMPHERRQLDLGAPYPVFIANAEGLRTKIGSAASMVGHAPDDEPGNRTRRLRFWFVGDVRDAAHLQKILRGGAG